MNAQLKPLEHDALAAAIDARAAARARLEASVATVDRAERCADDAKADVERHAAAHEATKTQHARALADWIAAGSVGDAPTLAHDERAAIARRAAESAADSASRAYYSLRATHRALEAAASAADRAVDLAVDTILAAEAEAAARRITSLEAQALELRVSLVALEQAAGPRRTVLSPTVQEVLRRPNTLSPPARYTDELVGSNGPHRARVAAATTEWSARIAALSGTGVVE